MQGWQENAGGGGAERYQRGLSSRSLEESWGGVVPDLVHARQEPPRKGKCAAALEMCVAAVSGGRTGPPAWSQEPHVWRPWASV